MAANRKSGAASRTNGKGVGVPSSGKKTNLQWEKPVLEDVSGKVMAQPYIRFT
jgi:hypothetical protein